MIPFFISIPHSGEKVPVEATWLSGLEEPILMCDVDRYVDDLYSLALQKNKIPLVKTDWHRYVIDLNRWVDDVDSDSVIGHKNSSGAFPMGLHWVQTTTGFRLMKEPITQALHNTLIDKYFEPFHVQVRSQIQQFKDQGHKQCYHLDAHSMPSQGTAAHRDPGSKRPQIVVSDCEGTSCNSAFKDLVIEGYKRAGFEVSYNWPYKGGRVTQTYGRPQVGQNTIQVEMNRGLYMNEQTKKKNEPLYSETQKKITMALDFIFTKINELPK